jgi:multidrug resistance efflux pump
VARRIVLAVVILAAVGYAVFRVRAARAPFEWSGTVEARTVEVGSRVGGRIQSVLAAEGQDVQARQPLLVLEPGDLPAQRLQAEGQLQQAQAALERVASQSLPTARRAEIAAAEARLQAAEAQRDKAKLDRDRLQTLFAGGASTKADLDNADLALRDVTAQASAQRAALDQLLQGTPQDVKAADGQVAVAKGRLQQIDVMLAELTVRAPMHARVESLDLRPGDILAPNATAAKLLEPDQLYVRIYVPETELGHVRLGQEVPVYVDSFRGRAFKGVVEYIASEGEFSPRNLQTADERADQVFASKVRIQEGRDVLRAGMAAFIRVPRQTP